MSDHELQQILKKAVASALTLPLTQEYPNHQKSSERSPSNRDLLLSQPSRRQSNSKKQNDRQETIFILYMWRQRQKARHADRIPHGNTGRNYASTNMKLAYGDIISRKQTQVMRIQLHGLGRIFIVITSVANHHISNKILPSQKRTKFMLATMML